MILVNENNELLSMNQVKLLKEEIRSDYLAAPLPTEEELELDLSDYYVQAQRTELQSLGYIASIKSIQSGGTFSRLGFGRGLWIRLRNILCKILNAASTIDDIIEAILAALASIIPGGVIIKWIVKKIVHYVINLGYQRLCPVLEA